VNVTWVNAPPTADAGPDQTVDEGVVVTLNGSNASDPDDGIAAYLWDQTSGIGVTLSDPTAAQPTFTAPDVGAGSDSLTFTLTVTDNGGLQSTDSCMVNVTGLNMPPTAHAGPDQTVNEEVGVTLDGSNSSDPDDNIADYLWEQTAGPSVTLSDPTSVRPSFTSPKVGRKGTSLTFRLKVRDWGGLQSADTCIVNVTWVNAPPKASVGKNKKKKVSEGDMVILDASESTDPEDGITAYWWEQDSGTPVTLYDPTAVSTTFVAPAVSGMEIRLSFRLTVTDDGGLQSMDEISVTVEDNGITRFPDDVITTTSSTGEDIGIRVVSGGSCVALDMADPSAIDDDRNRPENMIYGLIDAQFKVDTLAGTVVVIFYLAAPAPEGYTWHKYSPTVGWYDYSDHAVFNAARDQVTITMVDGGIGDDDGVANGVIVDPSVLGAASTGGGTPSARSDTNTLSGCFISAASRFHTGK
jgi:hypothetical protein